MIITYLLLAKSALPLNVLALSLLSGGALSNLLDRLFLGGSVVDFLYLDLGFLRTGIFNAADIAISLGVFFLGVSVLRRLFLVFRCASSKGRGGEAAR